MALQAAEEETAKEKKAILRGKESEKGKEGRKEKRG
jgi:hypothetical protein